MCEACHATTNRTRRTSGTPRFANLRDWLKWEIEYGKTARCCRKLSAEELNELEDEGRPLNCGACEYKARHDALWPQNAEAFSIYRALCGRTVGVLELHGWMFLSLTEGMSTPERHDVLARLDVIHAVLSPDEAGRRDRDDGSNPARHRSE